MADSNTTNYSLVKPEVGASEDTWGTKLNQNLDTIDSKLDDIEGKSGAATLKHTNSTKLQTTATGVDVTGTVTADGLTVDGTVDTPNIEIIPTTDDNNAQTATIRLWGTQYGTANRHSEIKNITDGSTANNELAFDTNGAERMRIDSSGNVGIGTSSPGSSVAFSGGVKLQTEDSTSTGYSASGSGRLPNGTQLSTSNTAASSSSLSGIGMLNRGPGGAAMGSYIGSLSASSGWGANIVFGSTSGSSSHAERARIDSSGNLLVGTTDSAVGVGNTNTGSAFGGSTGYGCFSRTGAAAQATLYVNKNTNDGTIVDFRKDGSTVGSIGVDATRSYFDGNSASGIRFGGVDVSPRLNGSNSNGSVDLGWSGGRFKDLYLSGGVYLGGTGSANKLDDYEEGTFTPQVFAGGSAASGVTYSVQLGTYTKIGNRVFVSLVIATTVMPSNSNKLQIGNLPFNVLTGNANYGVASPLLRQVSIGANEYIVAETAVGTSYMSVLRVQSSTTTDGVSFSDCGNTFNFNIHLMYATA